MTSGIRKLKVIFCGRDFNNVTSALLLQSTVRPAPTWKLWLKPIVVRLLRPSLAALKSILLATGAASGIRTSRSLNTLKFYQNCGWYTWKSHGMEAFAALQLNSPGHYCSLQTLGACNFSDWTTLLGQASLDLSALQNPTHHWNCHRYKFWNWEIASWWLLRKTGL